MVRLSPPPVSFADILSRFSGGGIEGGGIRKNEFLLNPPVSKRKSLDSCRRSDYNHKIMSLATLSLTAFRNHATLHLSFHAPMIALVGENGVGKTNILEAISLFTAGRGLRGAKLADFQQYTAATPWTVSASLLDGTRLGTGRDPQTPDAVRRVAVRDDQKVTPQAFSDHLALSWMTPAMDRLWTESPSARRKFLDRLTAALEPSHTTHINRYEEALAERNRLLREGIFDAAWLSGIEHTLATEGMAVAAARREVVNRLKAILPHMSGIFPAPVLTLDGVENWLDTMPALIAEDRLRDELARARRLDAAAGSTTLGTHRTDLQAIHPDKDMPASLCSTGEQKALIISLILAHATIVRTHRQMPPILLLDEIGAHLDEDRRAALFSTLSGMGGQVFMSGTDMSLFNMLPSDSQRIAVDSVDSLAPSSQYALCG